MRHSSLFFICVSDGSTASTNALTFWSDDLKNHHHLILSTNPKEIDLSWYEFKYFHPLSTSLNFTIENLRKRGLDVRARQLRRKRAKVSKVDRILFPYPLPIARHQMFKAITARTTSITDLDGVVVAFADEQSLLLARKLAIKLNATFSGDMGIIGRLKSGEPF